jgi:DMSO/TMAO reductase YedYZ molybdopterin-dependent catalytic subunit
MRLLCGLLITTVFTVPSARVDAQEAANEARADSTIILKVEGELPTPLNLTQKDLDALPRHDVTARSHDGKESRYEGVLLHDVLQKAGVTSGVELRGAALTLYLSVEAADGYRAIFTLPEIDPAFTDRTILLADRCDGSPLTTREGPIQVIVPGEKRHARWVRQVTKLRVGQG